jgi:hypothetical protein
MSDSIKILFFIASNVATDEEQSMINALENLTRKGYSVEVRNADQSALYGANLEECDYVAGSIPIAYAAIPIFGIAVESNKPVMLECIPVSATIQATHSKQLQVIKTTGETLDEMEVEDVTIDEDMTFSSSASGKASVSSLGAILGVATGSAIITASMSASLSATCTVTVTAHTS